MIPSDDTPIAWLQGLLRAFAWFNNKSDHGFTFTQVAHPNPTTTRQAIETQFGDDLEGLILSPVSDWAGFLRE